MGYSGAILAARPSIDVDVDAALVQLGFARSRRAADGWVEAEAHDYAGFATERIEALVDALSGPTLVVDVVDSDHAYLAAGGPGLKPAMLVLTPRTLRAAGLGMPSGRARRASVGRFVEWSAAAPRPMTIDQVTHLLNRGATFAEDLAWELLHELRIHRLPDTEDLAATDPEVSRLVGADDFVGYVKPLSWMGELVTYSGRNVPWGEYRFVPGQGDDFYGIWDRRNPSRALLTYPRELRGHERLFEDFGGLDARLDLGDAGDSLDGMIGLLRELYPAGRELRLADSRFLPGWGEGFAAVWDREAGPEPVVRFKGREGARRRAEIWATESAMPILAKAKAVGRDRWVSGHDAKEIDSPFATATLWLVAYEDADRAWPPNGLQGFEADGYLLHRVTKLGKGFGLDAQPVTPDMDARAVMRAASRSGSRGDWVRVPNDIPGNLFETARWAVEDSPFAPSLIVHPHG